MPGRYKPVGWRGESHRHYLAAKGIKTNRYFSDIRLFDEDDPLFDEDMKRAFTSKDLSELRARAMAVHGTEEGDLDGTIVIGSFPSDDVDEVSRLVNHEEMHLILSDVAGKEASAGLDNIQPKDSFGIDIQKRVSQNKFGELQREWIDIANRKGVYSQESNKKFRELLRWREILQEEEALPMMNAQEYPQEVYDDIFQSEDPVKTFQFYQEEGVVGG